MTDTTLTCAPKARNVDFSFWRTTSDGRVEIVEHADADTLLIVTDGEQGSRAFAEQFAALYGRRVTGENAGPAWKLA